jgi:hypothetical protein
MITPPPVFIQREPGAVAQRDIGDAVGSYVSGIISGLGSSVSNYVASGVPQYFQALPTGSEVQKSLGISDSDLAAKPTLVLNVPWVTQPPPFYQLIATDWCNHFIRAYANWTDKGWNVRVHGNVYKRPDISQDKLDNLANIFLIDTDIKTLPPAQQTQARNLTAEIFVVQQGNVSVTVNFVNNVAVQPQTDSGAINAVSLAFSWHLYREMHGLIRSI